MAKHVPLGEGTINDHEARIEKLEQRLLEVVALLVKAKGEYVSEMTGVVEPILAETPKKKKDKE